MSLLSPERAPGQRRWSLPATVVEELSAELFASLPRSDQRRKGELYLRGLLLAEGRKSIRNIAACVGDRAAEQSLHHFIASSTWDWALVRAALARYLERTLQPRAWAVRPVVISKAGTESVGVTHRFVPDLGQMVNSQKAYGLWAVGEGHASPVNWRLDLSDKWRDSLLGASPHTIGSALTTMPLENVASAAHEVRGWSGGPVRPVVIDLPDLRPAEVAHRFARTGTPFVLAARGTTPVRCTDPALPSGADNGIGAHRLLLQARTLRRPVAWTEPAELRTRTSLVVVVRIRLPSSTRPLVLLGEWTDPRGWPERCWISDLTQVSPGALLRIAKLSRYAERDFSGISLPVGLADFGGRSFEGWHRHVTLASAAHAVRMLTLAETSAVSPSSAWSEYGALG
ncbi:MULTISPECIES: IS701 family transposase [unclassified Streptomyces]|uniref:IS701 family transposase n=1 Tax=unclassified Streptomyces TaxID=2593676 RepID=UPI000DAD1DA8|nr:MULTISPECIES: transposase [unclassified Streptomyces]PZT74825.1 transposase [Streptomyces sp. AC1-42T]PZT82190.1 transposase [Streptomyces sp. AC1-42W]